MNQVSRIRPVTDEQAMRMVSSATITDLASQITATPTESHSTLRRRARSRRPLLLGVPLTAAVTAAVVFAMAGNAPSNKPLPPAASKALTFTVSSGHITVIVKNLYADTRWYTADLRQHHLDITLSLLPASPSIVGTPIFDDLGADITYFKVKGCQSSGGGECVGFTVPLGLRGQFHVIFGRPPRPGERYLSMGSAFDPGEMLHGMRYILGQPLSTVLAELRTRHLTVLVAGFGIAGTVRPGQAGPGPWYVQYAHPWAPGTVRLDVGHCKPTKSNPAPNC